MQAYGDRDRARAMEADDHRKALGMPDDIGGAVGNELCVPERCPPTTVLPDAADVAEDTRLPSRGRHYSEGVHLEPSEDYQGEFQLHFDGSGNGSLRVPLDVGDLAALRAALPGRREPTTAEVRAHLEGLVKVWDPDPERALDSLRRVISMLGEA